MNRDFTQDLPPLVMDRTIEEVTQFIQLRNKMFSSGSASMSENEVKAFKRAAYRASYGADNVNAISRWVQRLCTSLHAVGCGYRPSSVPPNYYIPVAPEFYTVEFVNGLKEEIQSCGLGSGVTYTDERWVDLIAEDGMSLTQANGIEIDLDVLQDYIYNYNHAVNFSGATFLYSGTPGLTGLQGIPLDDIVETKYPKNSASMDTVPNISTTFCVQQDLNLMHYNISDSAYAQARSLAGAYTYFGWSVKDGFYGRKEGQSDTTFAVRKGWSPPITYADDEEVVLSNNGAVIHKGETVLIKLVNKRKLDELYPEVAMNRLNKIDDIVSFSFPAPVGITFRPIASAGIACKTVWEVHSEYEGPEVAHTYTIRRGWAQTPLPLKLAT